MALADLSPSVIINADASQVYRDLRVVTARPSAIDEVRHPHRSFGYINGAEACSAARWADDVKASIAEAHNTARLPILVGGTGLYIRTLIDGIAPVPEIDPAVRAEVRALPVAQAHTALLCEDPAAGARLNPADATRVARALEVIRSTGRPLADWQRARTGGLGHTARVIPLVLLPPRDELIARCDARFAEMMAGGAIEEVETLLERNLDPALPVMRAIGVREIAAFLRGESTKAEAIAAGMLATRQYAKRQYTWFRNQLPADWPVADTLLDANNIDHFAIKLRQSALTA